MKALLVPKMEVEHVRKMLLDAGYLDTRRKILRNGDFFELPVVKNPPSNRYTSITQNSASYYGSAPNLKRLLKGQLNDEACGLLPRGWQIVGDIVIASLHPELYAVRDQVGKALLELHPNCKSVYLDEGIEGELRQPRRTLIAMKDGTSEPGLTVHREHGCLFTLDVTRIMFSKGNLNERIRMAKLGSGECVVDMFAGIGYFTIPVAVHSRPRKILAIELNPDSHHFLIKNIRLNNVEDIVEPVLGDCVRKTPVAFADRVIMGYVRHTHKYLRYGIRAIKSGGILHYHDTIPVHAVPDMIMQWIEHEAAAQDRTVEILHWHRVKKYSPGICHMVVDARIY